MEWVIFTVKGLSAWVAVWTAYTQWTVNAAYAVTPGADHDDFFATSNPRAVVFASALAILLLDVLAAMSTHRNREVRL